MVVAESVAADAVLEPEIEPNAAPASAVAIARPPGTRPTQGDAALNRSSTTPLRITNSAINRNIGTEINSYEFAAEKGVVCSTPSTMSKPAIINSPAAPAITSENATGVPSAS